jgi:S1-C subfamily serine protease/regulator of sirC expression with transglutaminase-like and TPR domain
MLVALLVTPMCVLAQENSDPFQEKPARREPERVFSGKTVADIAAQVRPSLVKVIQSGREGMDGLGAGFVIDADGLIATNKHVIGEARRIEVEFSDGERFPVIEITAHDIPLDLAVLRIAKKGLKPLRLGDSENLVQGEPIVAMGNPQGLDFSVVEGVISEPRREIMAQGVNREMIQAAVPIERGNSGGPMLNRKGEVLGLLTLKSLRTENLGFAMPVSELKKLVDKPNPIPMSRWLTIGVLDAKLWKTRLGATWTQRAGVVKANGLGDGFGGRTLCLWQVDEPGVPFEAQVSVRLEDESGAAGLIFCSDGGDRHYGFYPTAGKMRLTRFEGPDVYSWTILADLETDAYRPGDWNQLRVRVEGEYIQCFVNGRRILDQQDKVLRGGKAGVCKFRAPSAEFKGFRVGSDLAERHLEPVVAERMQETVQAFIGKTSGKKETLDGLLSDASAALRILTEKRKSLEASVTALRDLERDLHRSAMAREIAAELAKPEAETNLLRCALLLSKHDNPEVDVDMYLHTFTRMVEELKPDPQIKRGTTQAVARLRKYLFEENGFHGSRGDYESKSNSYMNEVLDDREGLPITLSVVFIELASRLGVRDVYGLPLPGRFMVGYRDVGGKRRAVDVFEGGEDREAEEAGASLTEDGSPLPEEFFQPATKKAILLRMIANLRGDPLESASSANESLPYLGLLVQFEPENPTHRLMRGKAREITGDKAGALEDVTWLMDHPPKNLPEGQARFLEQWIRFLKG